MVGRRLSYMGYKVMGSPRFRGRIHHELMKRAQMTEEKDTGTVFIMPNRKTAVSLGKSCRNDEYGWFSLDVYRITRFRNFRPLSSERKIFGEELHGDLMGLMYGCGRVEQDGGCSRSGFPNKLDFEDLPEPRKVWIRTCTIGAYHEIPPGGVFGLWEIENPRTFSTLKYGWREG